MYMKYCLHDTISFTQGWVTFSKYFTGKGTSPTNHCWCQKTRVIAISCGIKISAVHHLVLSQYKHLTDRQTDGQNCDRNTVCCITCSRTVKKSVSHSVTCRYAGSVSGPASEPTSSWTPTGSRRQIAQEGHVRPTCIRAELVSETGPHHIDKDSQRLTQSHHHHHHHHHHHSVKAFNSP